ncbi:MAG: PEP/pyruvate-binding domain-containing protein, partial [Acidimicrobiales bacterium]
MDLVAAEAEPAAPASAPFTVVLGEGAAAGAGLLGGKGAALERQARRGLPVPACGAVTTAAYRAVLSDPGLAALTGRIAAGDAVDDAEVDGAFLAADLPDALGDEIAELARRVGGAGRLAVRSSATVEDLGQYSFAGQYRSFLGVDATDPSEVLRCVRLVFASLWRIAPVAYRHALGVDDADAAMAAVVMRMVDARQAGVTFTVDPTRADDAAPSLARVELVEGLGESLVSGQQTPDVFVVERDGDPAVPPLVADALDLALRVEAAEGTPQDVEWAWDGRTLWLVQARPITTLAGAADDIDDPPEAVRGLDLTTTGIAEMLPGVLSPLRWGIDSFLVEEAFRRLLDGLGVLPPDLVEARGLLRRVHGRAALDFSRLAQMAAGLPGSAAAELEAQYFGSRRRG